MENHLYSLYQMILQSLTFYLGVDQEKKKTGRPPKVSDLQLCALFILSYITNTPEVRSLRIRYRKSKWLRFLVDSFGLMGDRGYRGCEYVEVCESKEQKGIRQVVEGVNSQIKLFNQVSRWRKGITLLAYLYGYAIGYSFFSKSQIWG